MYKFDVSPVYYANYEATEQVVINQGGTDSGKTYAIMQLLFTIATTNKAPTEDPIITVVGESVPNLKKGAYRVAKNIYNSNEGLKKYIKNWNETDRMIYFKSGWIIEFTSYENEQSAKQGKRQYSFFNEANGISWNVFWQVSKRTRVRTFVDYNPSAKFWAHEKLIGTDKETNDIGSDVKLIISDHRHNPFLSEDEHRRTENIKDKDLGRVYARGLTGNLEGIIYNDWQVIDYKDFPHYNEFIGVLDFVYTNDPTAGVKIVRIGESIFVHEICYTPGIAPIQMKQIFEANGFKSTTPIYCDHDPDQIAQLRRLGMKFCLPARKGQGSINAGIIKVKEFKVFYTSNSLNLHEERQKYMWAKDNKTGESTNSPIDSFNHLMDSIRYGVYTHYFKK